MNEIMHVGIERPVERRKEILNIAIDIIQVLKEFEISRRIRREKDVYRKEFVKIIGELNNHVQKLKDTMPAMHIPYPHEGGREEVELERIKEVKPVVKKSFAKRKTHMDELEDDIIRLREKIARL